MGEGVERPERLKIADHLSRMHEMTRDYRIDIPKERLTSLERDLHRSMDRLTEEHLVPEFADFHELTRTSELEYSLNRLDKFGLDDFKSTRQVEELTADLLKNLRDFHSGLDILDLRVQDETLKEALKEQRNTVLMIGRKIEARLNETVVSSGEVELYRFSEQLLLQRNDLFEEGIVGPVMSDGAVGASTTALEAHLRNLRKSSDAVTGKSAKKVLSGLETALKSWNKKAHSTRTRVKDALKQAKNVADSLGMVVQELRLSAEEQGDSAQKGTLALVIHSTYKLLREDIQSAIAKGSYQSS